MITPSNAASLTHATDDLYTKRREWNDTIVRAKTDTAIIELWQAHGTEFSCVNICTALISFAKWNITATGQSCICSMLQHYLANKALMRVRDAASTITSLAKMHLAGEEIEQIKKTLSSIVAKKAVGKSDFYDKPHLTSLVQILQSFEHQGQEIDPLLKAIEGQATRCFAPSYKQEDRFTQSVVEIATLYSKKGYKAASLFQEIQKQVLHNINSYSPPQLLRIAVACSHLELGSREFFDQAYRKVKRGIDTLDAASIESCLYVYGQSDEKLALVATLEAIIKSKIDTWSDKDFVTILASFANRQIGSNGFFDAMESEALNRIEQLTPNRLALVTSSFARVLAGSYSFFSTVEKKVVETIKLFETEDLVQLYHAYSLSRIADGKFLSIIEGELRRRDNLDPQATVVVIWSMLLARSIEEKYLADLLDLLNQACVDNTLGAIHPQTFIDIESMIKADVPELICTIKEPLASAIELCKQVMLQQKPKNSSLQDEVENALERCGYTFESQKFLDGVYVDIFIPSEKLAISVCDASHYYRAGQNELTALSLMKRRILEKMGYRLLHLPHFEWSWPKREQELYLKELFARQYTPIADLTYTE